MPQQLTNLVILGLVAGLFATGLAGWALPEPSALPLYDLHRLLGAALILLLAWKQRIVRRSFRRRLGSGPRDRSVAAGALTGLALLACLGLGLAWTLDLIDLASIGGYSPLNVHVQLGLVTVVLMLGHVALRVRRPSARHLVGRRQALRLVAVSAVAVVGWRLLEWGAEAADDARRPTGSKHVGSFSGNGYPVTIWLFDAVPTVDAAEWRLQVTGRVATPTTLSYADLQALPARQTRTVLDCTGGWWSEQEWGGIAVGDVLERCGVKTEATTATVVSVTGHRWTFPLEELRSALLATHVGGELLSAGHGYPIRLVAPARRGFQWVKWVSRIDLA
jgi:DMSO/TMAO reductase YedYZ molybdopterin-dependent catalytic subunit